MPSQNALKLPATKPERMFSDAPPSRDDVTTSRTWLDCVDVNTFTNSGIIAPASVPQVMTSRKLPPQRGIAAQIRNHQVRNHISRRDGNHRRQPDQRCQRRFKVHLVARSAYRAFAIAPLMK